MKIRLSKVIKDLNVGMSTVVEYLQKNGFGIEADANPNTQISEEQYEALRKEFSKDKNIKKQSDIISFERQNKEKNKKSTVAIEGYEEKQDSKEKAEMIKTEIPKEQMLKLKPVGKINLDEHNNPIKKEEKTGQTAKTSPDNIGKSNESKTVEKNDGQAQTAETHPTEADNKETPSSQQTKTNTVTEQKQQEDGQAESDKQTRTAETGETTEKDVYKIHSQGGSGLKLNVVGQIDLDSINQSTRPKKKSKEEKKKEREEKDRLKAEQRKKYGISADDQLLIFAGRISQVKGIEYLAETFSRMEKQHPKLRLIIAGDGCFEQIFPLLKPAWSKVIFTGFVDKPILYELFSISDIGILPSLHEEFGFVALEMMMMKVWLESLLKISQQFHHLKLQCIVI